MSTELHHGPRWGANFARLLHTTVCRVMACWLILTLPLYGLPVHAHAPTSPTMTPLPESFGLPFAKETPSGATASLPNHGEQTLTALSPILGATAGLSSREESPSSTLYVNSADSTCHNQHPCFPTIQAAIDAVQSGQTIRIQAGEYDEAIRIKGKNNAATATETDRIVIEADPDAAPGSVILGSASQKCAKGDAIQIESSKFVTLRGLTITDTGAQSLQLFGGNKRQNRAIHIERNRIYGNGTSRCQGGILIGPGNPDIVIVNNLIYGNGQEAIRITGSKGGPHYIVHNTIHDNRREGVDITKGQTVVLLNNLITANGADSRPKAQLVGVRRAAPKKKSKSENAQLLHNLICGNKQSELSGPMLDGFDAGNLTPTGAEGPGVIANPACADMAAVYANVNGPDGEPNTADDDFTLALNSPAIDLGTDPRQEIPTVDSEIFQADFTRVGARPQDGDANGTFEFDSGAIEVGHAPVAAADSYEVDENTLLTVPAPGVLGNDTDPDHNSLTAIRVSSPSHGALSLNPDGSFSYTPETNFVGTDTFTYKANDGHTDSNVATVTITVKRVNHPPVLPPIPALHCTEGQLCSYDVDATDPDEGDVLTYSLPAAPEGMTINPQTGLIEWTPTAAQVGSHSVTVKVEDSGNLAVAPSFMAEVAPVDINLPPVAQPDAYSVDAGFMLAIAAPGVLENDSDPDGNPITAVKMSDPTHGSLTLETDGSFIYVPQNGFSGDDTFTYKAFDGSLYSEETTVTITVEPEQHPPTITSTPTTARWEQLQPTGTPPIPRYAGSLHTYDEVNDRLIVFGGQTAAPVLLNEVWVLSHASGLGGAPAWTKLEPTGTAPAPRSHFASGYDPTANRLIVNGGCLGVCGSMTADTWVLTNANGLGGQPEWLPLPSSNILAYGVGGYDPVSNRLVVFGGSTGGQGSDTTDVKVLLDANGIGDPRWVTLSPAGNRPPARGHSQPGVYDPLSNTLIVFGGQSTSSITGHNDVWVLSHANGLGGVPTWTQLSPIGLAPIRRQHHMMAYDPNSNRLIAFGGGDPVQDIRLNDTWVLTHANGQGGTPEWIKLVPRSLPTIGSSAMAGYARSSNRLIAALGIGAGETVTVLNDVWVLANANGQCTAGQPCNYDVDATDPDVGDTLTFSLETAPTGMTIDPATGLIEWTPTPAQIGDHNVQVRVTDPSGLFAIQAFTLTVAPVAVPNVMGLDPDSAKALIGAADLTVGTETHTGGEIKLNFDTLPSQQGWKYVTPGNSVLEASVFSLSGTSLLQNTIGIGGRATWYEVLNGVDSRLPMSVQVRARIVAEDGGTRPYGFCFDAYTDTELFSTGLGLNVIADANLNTVPFDNTQFHQYRMNVVPGDAQRLMVDGQLVQTGKPRPTAIFGGIPNQILFGDCTENSNARAEITAYSFTQPRVTSQNPPAGTLVPNKSDVDLTIQDGPATATVPNVVGMTRSAAEAAIVAASLKVGTVTEVFSLVGPAGSVISQKPVAGAHVVPQTAVDLVVSRGPPPGSPTATNDSYETAENTPLSIPAPGVLGNDTDPQNDALTAILVTNPTHGAFTLNPDGSFTYTPEAGFSGTDTFTYKAHDGSLDSNVATVTITIAGGSQTVLVPNIVGKMQADATAMIVAADLKVGVVAKAYSDTVPAGKVISQNPAAGTAVARQSAVDLVISLGPNPTKVTVPDVVGQTQTAATTTLTNAELGVGHVTPVDTTIPLSFSSLPSTQGWGYGVLGNSASEAQVFSLSNDVLQQNTLGLGATEGRNVYQRATGVLAALPFALTVTARVLQEEGDPTDAFGFGFSVAISTERFAFGLRTNGIHGPVGNLLSTAIDTTQFHTYRLEGTPGVGFRLFVDGILTGSSAAGVGSPAPVSFISVGDLSDTANARGEIKGFSFVQGAGLVIDQNPDAGVLVSQGSLVDVTIAKAAENVSVPNVVGHTKANAISTLLTAKLLVGDVTEDFSASVPQGSVISQNPMADSVVPERTAVDLKISRGPPQAIVPNVVGKTREEAEAALLAAKLIKGAETTQFSSTVPKDRVISQSPLAGTTVNEGSAVSLVISLGIDTSTLCPLSSILVQPDESLILVSQTQAFTAIGVCTDGTSQNLNGKVTWGSSAASVATIDNSGIASGIADGATIITASLSGVTGSIMLTVRPVASGDTTFPTAEISAPTDNATITSLTDVIGTATDANFFKYVLEYAPVGTTAFTVLKTGTSPVTNGVLGSFDPTLLINDLYTLRLTVFDRANNTTTAEVRVQVDREQKVGNFTLAFQDVSIPMACLPITVTRTYDSRDKQQGDFGVGWRLDVNTLRLRESSRNEDGKDWRQEEIEKPGPFGMTIKTFVLVEDDLHKVSLSLPDGKVEEFDLTPQPSESQLFPLVNTTAVYTPRPGTLGSLAVPANQRNLFVNGGELLYDDLSGLYDPPTFLYTTPDGTTFTIHRTNGVQSVQCTNGQTLTFGPNGITHSAGKGVVFTRDAQGRITHLTDPNGHVHQYAYNANGDLISYSDPENNLTKFTYNFRHGMLDIVDPRGVRAIRNEYDPDGRLISSTDADGEPIIYTHDLATRTEKVKDRLGHETTFKYDDKGNVLEQIDALGNSTKFTYDAFGNEEERTDPLGHMTKHTYFPNTKNVKSETDPLGNTTEYTYSALNAVKTITDPLLRVTTNNYDAKGNLTKTIDPLGHSTTYTYDDGGVIIQGSGNLLSTTDALNHTTHYDYDAFGNVKKETDATGHETTYTYDNNGNRIKQMTTRVVGGITETLETSYEYDGLNRLVKTIFPDNTHTRTEYNAIGKQSATFDQLDRKTSYEYDNQGRLKSTTYPDGSSESSTYDEEGRRKTSTDRAGRVTSYDYDELGRLTKTTHPDGAMEKTKYDAAGQVEETTDALGHVTKYEYDAAGRRTKVTDALNHVTRFTYDAVGNQKTITDANGHVTLFVYDDNNRRTTVTYPDNTEETTGYDALGRTIKKTDQAGKMTQFEYDALGRLKKVTDALNQETTYTYDELGNQLTQTDALGNQLTQTDAHQPPRTTTFAYDQLGRRIQRTLPLGQVETSAYNAVGNLTSKTDFNGKTTTYAYDAVNRLITKTPDPTLIEQPVTFTYTTTGQRKTMNDASGETAYTYDNRDRLTSKATSQGTLTYAYDLAGNLLSMDSSNANGVSIDYAYDALNRLSKVTDNRLSPPGETTYAYDNVGNLDHYEYPNGVRHQYVYNNLNRLTDLTVGKVASPTLASYLYDLGPAGNRTAVTEKSGRKASYTYDDLYRLTEEKIENDPDINGTIGYVYDPVGNRLSRTSDVPGIANQTFTYDANDRLNTDTYDANGNTKASDGKTYDYDYENHLTEQNGSDIVIVYDGDGNRVSKTVGGVTTQYLVDDRNLTGYAQVVEEIVNGTVDRVYTYGLDLISQKQGSGVSYYGYDGHGSVRFLTDVNGNVTDTYTYEAFGNLIASTGTTPNNYLYTGEQSDPNLGFYYLRARYLNNLIGRFLVTDYFESRPVLPVTFSWYAYGSNNPITFVDPSGRWNVLAHNQLLDGLYFELLGFFNLKEIQLLKDVSEFQDSWANQNPDRAFMHAMSDGTIQNRQLARLLAEAQYNQFLETNFQRAKVFAASNNRPEALTLIGKSLHAIADNTSPEHEGFQPWSLSTPVASFVQHPIGELFIDGTRYRLALSDMVAYYLRFESERMGAKQRFGINFGEISRMVARERLRYNAAAELLAHHVWWPGIWLPF